MAKVATRVVARHDNQRKTMPFPERSGTPAQSARSIETALLSSQHRFRECQQGIGRHAGLRQRPVSAHVVDHS